MLGSSFYYGFLLVERLKDRTQRRNIVSMIVNHIDRRYKLFIIFETTIWLHLSINILSSFVSKIKNRDKVFLIKNRDKVFSVKLIKVLSVKFIEVLSVKFIKVFLINTTTERWVHLFITFSYWLKTKIPTQRRNIVSIIVNHIDRRYKTFYNIRDNYLASLIHKYSFFICL